MSTENGAYRWWENYLVRYLMPSIAGAVIVNWLVTLGGAELRTLLLLGVETKEIRSSTLLLLFLYGNLFCYIASYPILGFHVTRVIDFDGSTWTPSVWDGYVSTLIIASLVLLFSLIGLEGSCAGRILPFAITMLFVGAQLYRIKLSFNQVTIGGITGPVAKVFAYPYALSRRRGIAEELWIEKSSTKDQEDEETGEKFNEESERQKRKVWRRDFVDTYRHMREHGNSAFIFILELVLAGLCFLIISAYQTESATIKLSLIGLLLGLWAMPAIFIHLAGQHIERRFSWYDRRNPTNKD